MNKTIKSQMTLGISSAFCLTDPFDVTKVNLDSDALKGSRIKKQLRSTKKFDVHKNRIYYKNGDFVDGLARWSSTLEFQFDNQTFRYRTLLVKYSGRCYGFAIRATGSTKITALPGLDLTKEEVAVLLAIANEVSEPGKNVTVKLVNTVKKRATAAVKTVNATYDEGTLLNILSDKFIRETLLCGFLANRECTCKPSDHSRFAVNFLITRNSGNAACECFQSIMRAVDFTAPRPDSGCPKIEVKEKLDLRHWERQRGRMVILSYASEKAVRPIWKECERMMLDDCESKFMSLPLLLGRSSFPTTTSYEVVIPQETRNLTMHELQILRAASANLWRERKRIDELMPHTWHWLKVSGAEFILPYPIAFMQAFSRAVGEILFTETKHVQQFKAICDEGIAGQLEQQELDSQALDHALKLLLDPARYANEIIESPETKELAEQLLSTDAVAFLYSPKKSPAICFTEGSLLRLLHRVDFRDELIDRFIKLLRSQGIIGEKRKSLYFANSPNGRFITISLSKCQDFDVSLITARC